MERSEAAAIGMRIRDKRQDRGVRQADLAKSVEISPSYLNLIEHGRRRIGSDLLERIARQLLVEPNHLAHGTDRGTLDQLRHASSLSQTTPELGKLEEMAARYPGWAALIAEQFGRITTLEAQLDALRDRMTHDPALAAALHDVISSVTSIRSTASILTGEDSLDADWLRRFHTNIHGDAIKLAELSEVLVRFLENPDQSGSHQNPYDEASQWLEARGFHLASLEEGGDPVALVAQSGLSAAGKGILRDHFEQYLADCAVLPLQRFAAAAVQADYDPAVISAEFDVGLDVVLRRMASLPMQADMPQFGLAMADLAGGIGIVKPVPGLTIPRGGVACALWPLFTALSQPGRPIRTTVELPGTPSTRMLCLAQATQTAVGFDAPPVVRSVMLVVPDVAEGATKALPIGPQCRICPRSECAARREPQMTIVEVSTL